MGTKLIQLERERDAARLDAESAKGELESMEEDKVLRLGQILSERDEIKAKLEEVMRMTMMMMITMMITSMITTMMVMITMMMVMITMMGLFIQ